MLEKTVDEILSAPEALVTELFLALWDLMSVGPSPLTKLQAQFIHDVVVVCYVRYREKYEAESFEWLAERITGSNISQAYAYFALLSLPESLMNRCRVAILSVLAGTEFEEEARRMF
jgi:hypothetical protein